MLSCWHYCGLSVCLYQPSSYIFENTCGRIRAARPWDHGTCTKGATIIHTVLKVFFYVSLTLVYPSCQHQCVFGFVQDRCLLMLSQFNSAFLAHARNIYTTCIGEGRRPNKSQRAGPRTPSCLLVKPHVQPYVGSFFSLPRSA